MEINDINLIESIDWEKSDNEHIVITVDRDKLKENLYHSLKAETDYENLRLFVAGELFMELHITETMTYDSCKGWLKEIEITLNNRLKSKLKIGMEDFY